MMIVGIPSVPMLLSGIKPFIRYLYSLLLVHYSPLFSISSCFLSAGDGGMSGVELDQGRFRVSGVRYSDKKGAL